jgi:hypothetical protein
MDCYCETSWPYWAEVRKARTGHKCLECGHRITPGEQYEHVRARFEGDWFVADTCALCIDLRAYVTAHVPCFCMMHGSLLDDAHETIDAYAHEAPGLFMGYGRRVVAIRRRNAAAWAARAAA